ncbi:MAG: M14 family metallopeptidase [Candidatus Methanomethylicia archaeon]|nr:M14 family metallopeptidase [Candidatus Methanomethylicia archaeon]
MSSNKILHPKEFFGFEIGEDRKLARWDKIVEYFYHLAENSNKIKVVELGKTTEGNPFILAYISSPKNLEKLEEYRRISYTLANPRELSDSEAWNLAKEGKGVVAITNSLHATEVGGTQMAIQLAYHLITSDDEITKDILDNVILLLFPCFNPDGQIMVIDWYYKYLGTEYEGTSLPWLYHKYTGHDNNRDAIALTQKESQMFTKVVFKEWMPQVFIDNHQMGSYGARLYIPPWYDPICPEVDPLVYREHQWFGGFMAVKLEEAGIQGVEGGPPFTAEWTASFLNLANLMNICAMLTESASVKIATPIYIHKHQLTGHRGRMGDKKQYSFPNPWPGGWWKLENIIKQIQISNLAALELTAKMKETILYNMYTKAKRNIKKGLNEPPYAFIISLEDQHDPNTALKMLDIFRKLDVEVHIAKRPFKVGNVVYPEGTYVIFAAQPKRAFVKYVLEKTVYPDDEWTRARDGTPIRPYDVASYTIPDYMGVNVDIVYEKIEGDFEFVNEIIPPSTSIYESKYGYMLDCRLNDSFAVVNVLLTSGFKVFRVLSEVNVSGKILPVGSFYIPIQDGILDKLKEVSVEFHIPVYSLTSELNVDVVEIKLARIGIYQRYYGGNMDEGWTRWLLEYFRFPVQIIKDDDIKSGAVKEKLDILIFADDNPAIIVGENKEAIEKALSERFRRPFVLPPIPPEYMSGIKKEGVEKIREFVVNGGTLLTFNGACEFAIETLKLKLNNIAKTLDPKVFFCPGSVLKVNVDNMHPLCYGMPKTSYVFFYDSPVIEILPTFYSELYEAPVTYVERDIKSSGWLIGESYLSRKPALIIAKEGKGKVVLYAFRPQFRAQTHATFKLLFNALYKYSQ